MDAKTQSILYQVAGKDAAVLTGFVEAPVERDEDFVLATYRSLRDAIAADLLSHEAGIAGGSAPAAAASAPAASSAPSDAGSVQFSDKYKEFKGQTIAQVYAAKPGMIKWVIQKGKNDFMKNKCQEYLNSIGVDVNTL